MRGEESSNLLVRGNSEDTSHEWLQPVSGVYIYMKYQQHVAMSTPMNMHTFCTCFLQSKHLKLPPQALLPWSCCSASKNSRHTTKQMLLRTYTCQEAATVPNNQAAVHGNTLPTFCMAYNFKVV